MAKIIEQTDYLPGHLYASAILLLGGGLLTLYLPALLWVYVCLFAGMGALLCLMSPYLCACGITLFLYTGILTAVKVGFTFKAPQLFALLGVAAITARCFLVKNRLNSPRFREYWPFVLFFLAIFPSLWNADIYRLQLAQDHTSIRLILNYGLLQVLGGVVFLCADSQARIQQLLELSLLSCFASLCFGYFQQVGFYLGAYDPFLYIDKHSSIVDLYGPFLRMSPGTFANEYGEILQTCGIILIGLLYLNPTLLQGWRRWFYQGLLFMLIIALIVNFTRASWLVFTAGTLLLLTLARVRWYKLVFLSGLFYLILRGLFYLSQQISTATNLLYSVGERFGELSDVTTLSAGQRLLAWQDAWDAFLKHPWVGNGWGGYIVTHNVPLQLLAETGLMGFLAFYLMMGWVSLRMWQGWRQATDRTLKDLQITTLIAFWGCLAFDMTNHGMFHFVLWFTIALGLAVARLNRHVSHPLATSLDVQVRNKSFDFKAEAH